jgi:hypothetical protein
LKAEALEKGKIQWDLMQTKAKVEINQLHQLTDVFNGVWQGVAMNSLKFHPALHALPFTPCERTTPETALFPLWPFQGCPACRVGGLWPSSTPVDSVHPHALRLWFSFESK